MIVAIGLTTFIAVPFIFVTQRDLKNIELKKNHFKFKIKSKIVLSSVLIMFISFCYSPIITFLTRFSSNIGINNTFGFLFIYAVSTILARLITGYYVDRKNAYIPTLLSMLSMIICLVLLYFCTTNILLCASAFFAGTSTGTGMNSLQTLCLKSIHPLQRGKAVSIFLFGFDSGMALGSFVFGMIVDLTSFNTLYLFFSVIVILGFLLTIIYRKPLRQA